MISFLSYFLIFLGSLFFSAQIAFSSPLENTIEQNNIDPKSIETKGDQKTTTNNLNKNANDIFGDEQTFPFVAGLGKNAAH